MPCSRVSAFLIQRLQHCRPIQLNIQYLWSSEIMRFYVCCSAVSPLLLQKLEAFLRTPREALWLSSLRLVNDLWFFVTLLEGWRYYLAIPLATSPLCCPVDIFSLCLSCAWTFISTRASTHSEAWPHHHQCNVQQGNHVPRNSGWHLISTLVTICIISSLWKADAKMELDFLETEEENSVSRNG